MFNRYSTYFEISLHDNLEKAILKLIQKLNLPKTLIKINKDEFNRHELYIFHLINDYCLAYKKSKDDEKAYRSNTLESLGKRNDNRQKRFDKNEEIQKDKSIPIKERLVAYYENQLLDQLIKRKRKFSNLILACIFINKEYSFSIQKNLFLNTKKLKLILEVQNEALRFFEFTYISKSKIANSCLICIYTYLMKIARIDEKIAFKFTEDIRKLLFKEDAVQKLLKSNLESQIYCDGIYNSTPIFHWYTPKDKKLYTDEELEEYIEKNEILRKETKYFKNYIYKATAPKLISKEEVEEYFSQKDKYEQVLLALCESYVLNPNKIIEVLFKYQKKPLLFYIYSPIKLIRTIFLYLNTK